MVHRHQSFPSFALSWSRLCVCAPPYSLFPNPSLAIKDLILQVDLCCPADLLRPALLLFSRDTESRPQDLLHSAQCSLYLKKRTRRQKEENRKSSLPYLKTSPSQVAQRFESLVLRHTHTAHLHRRVASHRIASSSPSSLVISIHSTDEAIKRLAPHRTASHRRRSLVDSTDFEESACRRAPRVVVVVSSRCRGDIHLFFSRNWYVTASSLRTVVKQTFPFGSRVGQSPCWHCPPESSVPYSCTPCHRPQHRLPP